MRLIIETSQSPSHNLAREEVLFNHVKEDTVYFWRNRPAVIIGRHQNTLAEIDEAAAEDGDIEIVRRLTGGGAVFHDPGNINFSFVFACGDFEKKKEQGMQLIIRYLQSRGAACFTNGRNDICMKDSGGNVVKICGTAMTQQEERGIFHGCILFDCNLAAMGKVLTPAREKLHSKGISSLRSRVANLRALVPQLKDISGDCFFEEWGKDLSETCRLIEEESPAEKAEIAALMQNRYENRAWNFGRNPACTMEISRRFPVGTVTFHGDIKGGVIKNGCFSGDYLSLKDFGEISERLQDIEFSRDAIEKALQGIELEKYFGTSNQEEILDFLTGRREESWHL